jgi:hypothetical protein
MREHRDALPANYQQVVAQFPSLIEPLTATIMEGREVGRHPEALALAAIAAGRDAVAELWGAEWGIIALRMALEAFIEANPEAAKMLDDAKRRGTN